MRIENLILYTLMICIGFYILWIYKFHSKTNITNTHLNLDLITAFLFIMI